MIEFPEFGKILSTYTRSANTPDAAVGAIQLALMQFWREIRSRFSKGAFMFKGTSVTGVVTTPVVGPVGGISSATQLCIPSQAEINLALHSTPEPFVGLFNLFSYTLKHSDWAFDCKTAGFATPCPAILIADFTAQALLFKADMFAKAPTTHEEAMTVLSDGVKDCLQTFVNEVQYVGSAGATQLTGTLTIRFSL